MTLIFQRDEYLLKILLFIKHSQVNWKPSPTGTESDRLIYNVNQNNLSLYNEVYYLHKHCVFFVSAQEAMISKIAVINYATS